ncbi:MAG: hypothetical protein ACKO2P_11570, partial [Planctomycetota bacterium]
MGDLYDDGSAGASPSRQWALLKLERRCGGVVGSAGTVPGGLAGRISAAAPWLCNRGYRCNSPNHHKPNNRPN